MERPTIPTITTTGRLRHQHTATIPTPLARHPGNHRSSQRILSAPNMIFDFYDFSNNGYQVSGARSLLGERAYFLVTVRDCGCGGHCK